MKTFLLFSGLCLSLVLNAQQRFSLSDALNYAAENSYNIKQSQLDIESAVAQVKETIGTGLPQINANGAYQNFIRQPVQVIPAEFFGGEPGTFQPVVFGTKQNLTADITARQLIFDGSYLVGVKAAQEVAKLFELQKDKSLLDVKKEVSNAYFMVLVAEKSAEVLKQNVSVLEKLKNDNRALYQEGFISETDADQLDINYLNLKNNYEFALTQKKLALLMLKFRMGMDQKQPLELSDSLEKFTASLALFPNGANLDNTVSISLVRQNILLQELNRKALQAQYLPQVNGFINTQQQSFQNEFNFFNSETNYFGSTLFGINVTVPIFSSFNKHYKIKRAQIDEFKAKVDALQVNESLKLQYANAEANLNFQFSNIKNQEKSLDLAQKIREKMLIKFKEGVSSSLEVSQSEQQFLTAQQNYTQALLDYLEALTEIKYLTNQL